MSLQSDTPAHDPLREAIRRSISSAADGEADALAGACQAWRDDPEARAHWHTVHLIGDVLRSTELASQPGHDAAFMSRLRERMAAEPVVLAPSPVPAAAAGIARRGAAVWLKPAAVAAGFAVVAGVLVVSRVSEPASTGNGVIAAAAPQVAPVSVPVTRQVSPAPGQGDRTLLRDARLDEYLRAHQAARGGMAVAMPVSGLRRVDAELPAGAAR